MDHSTAAVTKYVVVFALCSLSGAASASGAELPPAAEHRVDFQEDVRPVLERCQGCHGKQQQMSGLRLDRREDALRGGYSGAVILPGDSAGSHLIHLVAGLEEDVSMPPAGDPLTAAEIGILRAWIDQGVRWPEETGAESSFSSREVARAKPPSQPLHWSFRPVERPAIPETGDKSWVRNPIDAFVLARVESEGLQPSPEADRRRLVRRLYLDLIGLPPEPDSVAQFLADPSPDAYERVVERLLESKHYGEKWAIPWLDLARYAESDGYEKDQVRPHAWRYRHWVINALNDDMPFDEFTIEQIAGDLLPHAGAEQRVATGFHRNTLKNREGGVNLEQFRFEETVDRANTVSTVWLGLTLGCAQCHDHKYDPVSQKEYYEFFAFFDNLEETHIDAPLPGELGPYLRTREEHAAKRRELLAEYGVTRELMDPWEKKLIYAADHPGELTDWDVHYDTLEKMTDGGHRFIRIPPEERTERQQRILIDFLLEWYNQVASKERWEELKFRELQGKLRRLDRAYPQVSQARVIYESGKPRKTRLHVRGQWDRTGIEVEPGTPDVLPPLEGAGAPTRLDLARWIASSRNPLTARVAVNRIWQQYFGKGIVDTSENFGVQGAEPSHPELLDWLAAEFMDRGWRLKPLHKLIVTSATYRQSSKVRPEAGQRDPDNTLLARQQRVRLPAELIRDSALKVSGLLYPKVGGPSVQPPLPEGLSMLLFADGKFLNEAETAEGQDAYRRGVYVHLQRTLPYPFLANFDAPDGASTVCRRERSNTPLQALNLLNDPVFFEAAQGLALRILQEAPGPVFQQQLEFAFRVCVARAPAPYEQERLLRFYVRLRNTLENDPSRVAELIPAAFEEIEPVENAAWVGLSRVLLNMDEFITRE